MKKNLIIKIIFILLLSINLFGQRQVIISTIEGGLIESENYTLTNMGLSNPMLGINIDTLDNTISNFYSNPKEFIIDENNFSYPYSSKEELLILPIEYNSSDSVVKGNFQLSSTEYTENGDPYKNILIDENYVIPASTIVLEEIENEYGNKFSYVEKIDITNEHFLNYKNQEYLIRISYENSDSDFDIYNKKNPIKLAVDNDIKFLRKEINYIDFFVDGDDYGSISSIETNYGLALKFIPGNIVMSGLPNGEYSLSIYSIRYSKDMTNKGYVVITKEDAISYVSDEFDLNKTIFLRKLYEGNHSQIEANLFVISTTTTSNITVTEEYKGIEEIIIPTVLDIRPFEGDFYLTNSNVLSTTSEGILPDIDNNPLTTHYLLKVNLEYISPFTNKDNFIRNIKISNDLDNLLMSYNVIWNTLPIVTDYPHQTVIAMFNPVKNFEIGPYEIKDKIMSKYTHGYRKVEFVSNLNKDNILDGLFNHKLSLSFDKDTFLWNGNPQSQSGLIINKATSDSRGKVYSYKDNFEFYTLEKINNFIYEEFDEEDKTEKATFLWNDSNQSSSGEIINDLYVLFRISRVEEGTSALVDKQYKVNGETYIESLPKYYLDLLNKENTVANNVNNLSTIENFVSGDTNYLDLVFVKGEDKELEGANAIFTFSKENIFKIIGLPRGKYLLQLYTVKSSDLLTEKIEDITYVTLNYEGHKEFEMGLPTLVTGDFASKNNIFMIENINVFSTFNADTGEPVKNIQVNFITKAEESLIVKLENLIAKNSEEINGNSIPGYSLGEWHEKGYLEPIMNATIQKSNKGDFQFPLDIIFLVDNSGSMQNEIDATKDGLKSFAEELEKRGFDVKFNLITFGPDQNRRFWVSGLGYRYPVGNYLNDIYRYYDNGYLAIYKQEWFDDVDELINGFSQITAISGYYGGQENGGPAIKWGADLLVSNGRYLNYSNEIVSNSSFKKGFIPSKKWLIFLTDENMDDDNLRVLPNISGYNSFMNETTEIIKDESISLTGIYHIDRNQRDDLGNRGENPADRGDRSYNVFEGYLGDLFSRYEMGSSGQYVSDALLESVDNVGIIQRWTLTYESPFNESDGFRRQVVYSLDGFQDIKGNNLEVTPLIRDPNKDRYYRVPEEKIEAYFTKPSNENRSIYKKDGKIIIEVRARSQYNELNESGETNLTNYRIEKGYFRLIGNGNSLTLSSDSNDVNIIPDKNGWYLVRSEFDSEVYDEKFGKETISIQATVATKENGKTINISNIEIIELDSPVITEFIFINETLKELLFSLKDEFGVEIFDENVVEDLSKIYLNNSDGIEVDSLDNFLSSNKLNVKSFDRVSIIIKVKDESIEELNDTFIKIGDKTLTITKVGNEYKGEIILENKNNKIIINIVDDFGNVSEFINELGAPKELDAMNFPELIEDSNFENLIYGSTTYYNSILTSSPSIDKAQLEVQSINPDILAYFILFNYSDEESDGYKYDDIDIPTATYNLIDNNKYWASSIDNKFLLSDGKYEMSKVYLINKAGGFRESVNTLDSIINYATVDLNSYKSDIFVDTVAPRIKTILTDKVFDSGTENILGQGLEFKEKDKLVIQLGVEDYNYNNSVRNNYIEEFKHIEETYDINSETVQLLTEVLYDNIEEKNNFMLEIEAFDKASNYTRATVSLTYNTITPKLLTTVGEIVDDDTGNKFTNLLDYKIDEIGVGDEIAYAKLIGSSNQLKEIIELPIGISYFENEVAYENTNNLISITTYNKAGLSSADNNDQIVIDTDINGVVIPERKAIPFGSSYIVDLDLSQIEELVGLKGFKPISNEINGIQGGSLNGDGYYPISGAKYSTFKTTSYYNENYKLVFDYPSTGLVLLKVELIDRLGNTREVEVPVLVNVILEITGKKINSDKESKSTVEIDEELIIKETHFE